MNAASAIARAVIGLHVLLLLPATGWTFAGRVVSADGTPVANAEVTILGHPGVARTDPDGRYTWAPDPPPPFELLVVAPGGIYMKPVLVERAAEGLLELTVTPLLSELVTVSGSAASIDATPAAGTATLTAREIGIRGPANLAQALENVAGVSQVSEGRAAVPAVRGLARGRTLILIDGARVSSERRVGPGATFLDPAVIEDIHVARGPGSVAYGSDAFGGVISVRTRSAALRSPLALSASTQAGTGVPERRATLEVAKGFARGGAIVMAHARDVEDYDGPDGRVVNSGYADHGVLGRAIYLLAGGILSAGWQSDFGRDIGRPRDNSRDVRIFYPIDDSHRLTVAYEAGDAAGFSRLHVTGFGGWSEQTAVQDRVATARTARRIERAAVSARDFQVRGSAERIIGAARLNIGVDVHGRHGLHARDTVETHAADGTRQAAIDSVSIDGARRTDAGLYASVDAAVAPRVSLAAGVRGDRVATSSPGGFFGRRSTAHGAASGFVAVTTGTFRGLTATAQLARGFRDPTLSDRYFRGPSGRGFVTGNPDLAPESSVQVDLGLRYTSSRVRAASYFYSYRLDDLIERYAADADSFFFRNRGRARLRGFEAELEGTLGWGVSLESAFHVARGRTLDAGAHLDDVAPETASVRLRKNFEYRRTFVQVRAAFVARDARPGPTERVVPGHTLLDAAGGIRLFSGMELRVSTRNLLDARYLATPDTRAVAAPGRSIAVSTAVRLGGR